MKALRVIGIVAAVPVAVLGYFIVAPPRVRVDGIPDGFAEKQYDSGEVTLNYVEGPDNGPPLLLIPGQMESWQGYKPVMPALAERYHVFSVDLRGHGKSSRTPGQYSYNICGQDLKLFMKHVVREPAFLSGLSSGAVLTVWLAANAPESVSAIVAEDPPMFSSIWPRVRDEKYMQYIFQHLVDSLGKPEGRDLLAYFAGMGIPQEGKDELLLIPRPIAQAIVGIFEVNRRYRPQRTWDPPFLPYEIRAGFKFLLEYDVDFSRATLDGRLSQGFDPDEALRQVQCPMLLLKASSSRDPRWGLLGALDEADVQRIQSLVKDVRVARLDSRHAIHMAEGAWYLEQVTHFLN